MKKFTLSLISLALLLTLAACGSGPQTALDLAADALENKNAESFAQAVDLDTICTRIVLSKMQAFNFSGKKLTARPVRVAAEAKEFKRLIENGFILKNAADFVGASPWNPEGLRDADVHGLMIESKGDTPPVQAALASVEGANGLRAWVVLKKNANGWQIVGSEDTREAAAKLAQE